MTECTIKNNTTHDLTDVIEYVKSFYPYAQRKIGFNKPPMIVFDSDPQNAAKPLGKTAYYKPSTHTVTVFVDGRHTKDVLRSVAHELIHHGQNCRGDFNGDIASEEGYAQSDPHLRNMEKEAYMQGNIIFRDWEDNMKKKLKETIYYENRRIGDMSLEKWKNNELNFLLMKKFKLLKEDIQTRYHMRDEYKTTDLSGEELEKKDDEDEESDESEAHTASPDNKTQHKPSEEEIEESYAYHADDDEEESLPPKALSPEDLAPFENRPDIALEPPPSKYPEESSFGFEAGRPYNRDDDDKEQEPVDLEAMDSNEAFGLAWSKAIEILQDAGYSDAACKLSAESGGDPNESEPSPEEEPEETIPEASYQRDDEEKELTELNESLALNEWYQNNLYNKLKNLWSK